ncbi:hypothetical protein KUCAC02_036357, partial [Chaenocephalus aceratus]
KRRSEPRISQYGGTASGLADVSPRDGLLFRLTDASDWLLMENPVSQSALQPVSCSGSIVSSPDPEVE